MNLSHELRIKAKALLTAADILDEFKPQRSSHPKPKHMSAATRRKLSLAQKKRWAIIKGQTKVA